MGDWHQLLESVFIGLLFSYLLAKLISVAVAFKEDNLSFSRNRNPKSESDDDLRGVESSSAGGGSGGDAESLVAEHGSVDGGDRSDDEDDDEWEGVECTELDEAFSAATAFVATAAADRLAQKVSTELQLQLYGLYKIATEGPCSSPQPSALKITARSKWQAWKKLGIMPPEEAMQKYIDIVTTLYPNWVPDAAKDKAQGGNDRSSDIKGLIGPVFSSFVHAEESENDLTLDAIHAFAREGELDNLLKCIENGVPVNKRDSEGRTPLHWAVDRGHLDLVETLVNKNADVIAKDNEGQTPLHYAVTCDREAIAEFLISRNADIFSKDEDGNSPFDLCESNWPWIKNVGKKVH